MKIAVIGAGAIGSVVGAYLTKAGQDVILIGRTTQVEAINKHGLTIKGLGKDEVIPVKAATCLAYECDLVIFTVKTQDIEEAYQQNNTYLDRGLVLTSQNGVQADTLLSTHFERDRMLSSIVMFGATYETPGAVTYNFKGDWIVGRPYSPIDAKTHEVIGVLKSAFEVVLTDDIMGMKWLKLFINFNNCIPALTGKSMQETFANLDMCRLSVLLLREGVDVVHKANISLVSLPHFPVDRILGLTAMPVDQAAGILQQTLTTLSEEPLYGSILQSIQRKKSTEIDFINGEVTCMATQMRFEAPLNKLMVSKVHDVERTGQFLTFDEIKQTFQLGTEG